MLVKDCMTQNVKLAKPDISLQDAAKKMRDGDFGILPIAENDRLIGMVTDRDITIRAVAEGLDPSKVPVRQIMSSHVLYCYDDQTTDEVTKNLGDNQIRRIPVVNRQKRLVGILSLGDLAQSNTKPEKVDEALSRISRRTRVAPEMRV